MSILRHQRMALAWMVAREKGQAGGGPRGGILADDQVGTGLIDWLVDRISDMLGLLNGVASWEEGHRASGTHRKHARAHTAVARTTTNEQMVNVEAPPQEGRCWFNDRTEPRRRAQRTAQAHTHART